MSRDDLTALAKLRLEELLSFFGENTDVDVQTDGDSLLLTADVADSGRLIGHRGETLQALQHLVNSMVKDKGDERLYVSIDISGYKKARAEHLSEKARTDAAKVIETGKEIVLRPMHPAERRIVHMALQEIPGVVTESTGEGRDRRVVIKKKDA